MHISLFTSLTKISSEIIIHIQTKVRFTACYVTLNKDKVNVKEKGIKDPKWRWIKCFVSIV